MNRRETERLLAAIRGVQRAGQRAAVATVVRVRGSAYRREGTAMTTRDNVHRMADANKAFAHFAW